VKVVFDRNEMTLCITPTIDKVETRITTATTATTTHDLIYCYYENFSVSVFSTEHDDEQEQEDQNPIADDQDLQSDGK